MSSPKFKVGQFVRVKNNKDDFIGYIVSIEWDGYYNVHVYHDYRGYNWTYADRVICRLAQRSLKNLSTVEKTMLIEHIEDY